MKIKSDFYGTRRLFFHYLDDALREMTNKEKLGSKKLKKNYTSDKR